MNAYCADFFIQYDTAASGSWFSSDKMLFKATSANGMPLFHVESDGKKNCTVSTYSSSDPVNAILAAFAISVKLDPKDFHALCTSYCHDRVRMDSFPGMFGGFGPPDAEFEQMFPTPPIVQPPVVGYTFGVVLEGLPIAQPVIPTAVPFAVVEAQPTFEPLPMAVPLVTPAIGVEVAEDPIPMAVPVAEPWNAQPGTYMTDVPMAQPVQQHV